MSFQKAKGCCNATALRQNDKILLTVLCILRIVLRALTGIVLRVVLRALLRILVRKLCVKAVVILHL